MDETNVIETVIENQVMELPEAKTAQTLGIVSIVLVFCTCCYGGIIATILGFFAMSKAKKALEAYDQNPDQYSMKSFNQAKSAKTLGMIGGILGILAIIYIALSLVLNIALSLSDLT